MKKLTAAFLLTTAVSAQAQTGGFRANLPIICGPTNDIINEVKQDFGEVILFMGGAHNENGQELYTTLWGNEKTGTFTVIITNKQEEKSCILTDGDAYQVYPGESI